MSAYRLGGRWHPARGQAARSLPTGLREHVLDTGSLTTAIRRLCEAREGRFTVDLLRHDRIRLNRFEARQLGLKPGRLAILRDVRLCCDGEPWIFAHSVLPLSTLTGAGRRLGALGNKPLGAALFADPGIQRGPLELTRLRAGDGLYDIALAATDARPARVWGRRSIFRVDGRPLAVAEFFLPDHPAVLA